MGNQVNKLEIMATKDFDECFKGYGYEEFVRKVLHKCVDKKEFGLVGQIILFDAEPSKRVFFKNESGEEFTIRYFLQDETQKTWSASYILYGTCKEEENLDDSMELSWGTTTVSYVKELEKIKTLQLPYKNKLNKTVCISFGDSDFFNRDSLGSFEIESISIPNYRIWLTNSEAEIYIKGTWIRKWDNKNDASITIYIEREEIKKLDKYKEIEINQILELEWVNYRVAY